MMAGQGGGRATADVFEEAENYMTRRAQLEKDREKRKQMTKAEMVKRQKAAEDIGIATLSWIEKMKSSVSTAFSGGSKVLKRTSWQEERNAMEKSNSDVASVPSYEDDSSNSMKLAKIPIRMDESKS